jgi:Icc-related predicted phosphoesterase
MKILAIGDFHGEFPSKFNKIIKKEKIDLVVSNGDFFPFSYRKTWFKYCYGKDTELWEVIGKKKYKQWILKDLKAGEKALKKLNSLHIPVITVYGNLDYTRNWSDSQDVKTQRLWRWDNQNFFSKIIRKYKNIHLFSYSYFKFGDLVFIGTYGSSNKGDPKSKTYKRNFKKMKKLFDKFKRENREGKVIFVGHNVPYNTKLDKASMRAHPKVAGKHLGSKMIKELIKKYKPILYLGGHMHEAHGKQKVGRTLCINPGAAHEGKAAIINLEGNKIKSAKLIR